jgi:hypothetical protein
MLLSNSSMPTGSLFFDMLPFDVIEIILTFLVMGNGCDGKQCLQRCMAFMFCCKRAKSLMFQAKLSVKTRVMLTNIFDVPSKEMVHLLTRWGVKFDFDNSIRFYDCESLIEKKYSSLYEDILKMDVFPYLRRVCFSDLTQLTGMVYDFTKCHMSRVITLKNSDLFKVIFDGSHIYNKIIFNHCTFGYNNNSVLCIMVNGGTFTKIVFDYESGVICGRDGLKHLIIVNIGNTVAKIKKMAFKSCSYLMKITLKGGVELGYVRTSVCGMAIRPTHYVDASMNYI